MLKPAIAFEKSMAGVSKVVDFETPEGLTKLSSEILKLTSSGGLPMAAEGIAEIIEAAGKAGLIDSALPDDQKIRELINFATAAAKMGVAFDISAGQAGDAMAQWQAALGMGQQESIEFGDALNHIANNMNTTEAKLLNVIGYVGAVAKTAGLANNEIVALSGAILAAGASPERAATGLKNFTNALTKGEAMTKRQSAVIRELNMDADELAQRMQVDAKGAIIDVLEALKELPKYKQGAAIGALFGEEAKGAITPLLLNLDNLRKAFDLVADPENYAGAMLKEYAKQSATTDNALKLTMGFVKGLSITIGTFLLPELNELLATVQPMIAAATAWAEAHPELVSQIFRVVAGLLAFKVASIALRFTLFSLLAPFLFLIKGMSGLLIFLPRLAAGMLALLSPVKLVRGALIALRFALLATGIGALLAGIAMAGVWIYNNWAGLGQFFAGFWASFRAGLGPAGPLVDGLITRVQKLWAWLTTLLGPVDASAATWNAWGNAAGTAFGGIAGGVMDWIAANRGLVASIAKIYGGFLALKLIWKLPMAPIRMASSALMWLAKGPLKFVLVALRAVTTAALANPLGVLIAAVASVGYLIYQSWDEIAVWMADKVKDIRDAFDQNLILGVFKVISEFNPFTLAIEGAHILITKIMEMVGLPDKVITAWKNFGPLGGDDQTALPQIQNIPGYDALPKEHQAAAQTVQRITAAGDLPSAAYFVDLEQHALVLQSEIANIQKRIEQIGEGPASSAMAIPLKNEMSAVQEELVWVQGEMIAAKERANDLNNALKIIDQTKVAPEINTSSIDSALRKIKLMSDQLSGLSSTAPIITAATKATGPAGSPQGSRDRGRPVMANLPYLVGERGAEIFVPKMAGMIMSHGALKAASVMSALAGPAAMPNMAAAFTEPMQMFQQLAPANATAEIALPQIERDRTQSIIRALDHRPAARAAAPGQSTTHIDVGGITIVAQPGMDASAIARAVRRELQTIERKRTGDLHDGGEF